MQKRKLIILCSIILCIFTQLKANESRKLVVEGKVIEQQSQQPIEYATIAIYNSTNELLTGGISNEQGEFRLEITEKEIYITVSFIGYEKRTIYDLEFTGSTLKLNNIELSSSQHQLQDVVVRAEKSTTEFKLDKRVFNVGKDLTSAGGTAMDILNNVPSVDVSIEGTISLRGNTGVQILINGKPSVMASSKTLGTITAEMIEKVEVITNPSAKYDAEGTSGIINVILKKEERKGINGAVTANIGTPKNYSMGLSLNRRTEKFNLFTQLGVGDRRFLSESYSNTINKQAEGLPQTIADGEAEKNEQFYNFILGADYHITKLQTLSLSGHYGYEIEDEYSTTGYTQSSGLTSVVNNSVRNETTEATNPKWQYEMNYTKEFEDNEKRKLTASATGSFFGKDQTSYFENTGDFDNSLAQNEKDLNDFSEAEYNFQTDYIHPFSEKFTYEGGAKMNINRSESELLRQSLENGSWQNIADQSYVFDFNQNIAAAYSTFAFENDKWGLKAGLRVEHENTDYTLANESKNNRKYTHWFPSIHGSLKLDNEFSLQVGYSRRIHRPHIWDLNPFASYRDPLNISMGNPDLEPGLSNAFEFTAIKISKKVSLNASVFYAKNFDTVEDIYELDGNVRIRKPLNVGNSEETGLEINSKWEPLKWLSLMIDGYYMAYSRSGQFNDQNFNFSNDYWSTRTTTRFKLPYDFDIEYRFRYRSEYQSVQGTNMSVAYSDLGIRKQLFNKKAVLHLSVKDLFDSRKHKFESDQSDFYIYSNSQRSKRILVLGLSFGFGKGETMEYSGMKMF